MREAGEDRNRNFKEVTFHIFKSRSPFRSLWQEAREFGECLTFKQNIKQKILKSRKTSRGTQGEQVRVKCSEKRKLRASSYEGLFSREKNMKKNANPSINPL